MEANLGVGEGESKRQDQYPDQGMLQGGSVRILGASVHPPGVDEMIIKIVARGFGYRYPPLAVQGSYPRLKYR